MEPGARLVFAAGACPLDVDGTTVGVGDHTAQARQMMRNSKPSSTLLGVTVLGYDNQLVEIDAVAATAGSRPGV